MDEKGFSRQTLLRAREILRDVTPLPADCGMYCGAACCASPEEGADETGMLLFPGEEALYTDDDAAWMRILPANLYFEGMPVGLRVTLRKERMYEFLERLIVVSLPRIRDFKGINEKFDGHGNYSLGITEHIIFPEIDIDKISQILGLEISFVTSTGSDEEAYALLKAFGLPFKNIKKTE